ncbi:MAG: response regulator [Rhizobiales bacterium]|nr:response regulator [Hyphomicrobiales bacterium]
MLCAAVHGRQVLSMDLKSLSRDELEREVARLRGLQADAAAEGMQADALRAHARYRALFEAIDDGFCIIGFMDGPHGPLSDYVHVEANTGYERHTGISDIVGKRLREIEPANADVWLEIYGGVLRTGQPVRFEQEFKAVGRFIEVSATRIEPESLCQVAVLFRDVTARRLAEAALRESESRARDNVQRVQLAMAAGAIIGTWFWDVPSDRFTVDEGFAAAFGLDPEKGHTGLSLADVTETVHPDDRKPLVCAIRDALSKGGAYAHQFRTRRADGKYYWLEANGRVEHGPDGRALKFPGVVIDIEGRRAVEAERDRALAALRGLNDTLEQRVEERTAALMQTEAALRQAQKMEAVGQLTGGLAHDFNNILAGVSGSLDLMKTRLAQGRIGEIDRYLAGAQGAVKRAAALTQRLLAFSRRQTLDPKASDINRIVAGMQELISRSVGPGVAVETVAAGGLWMAFVDVGQLENALLNLCINARDAMPDGGAVRIYSEVGRGTMVCIYLPRHAAEQQDEEPPLENDAVPMSAAQDTILVVDDEPLVRMVAVDMLEELGYVVLEAGDGPSALKILEARPEISLLVTDVGLPNGMNGRQLADVVRGKRPDLNVLFVTGYAENAVLNHGHLERGMQVVTKPFTAETLARRVKDLIGGEA